MTDLDQNNQLALNTAQVEAVSVYDTDFDNEDIFASDEQIAELKKEGLLDQQSYTNEEGGGGGDPSWRYHRVVTFGDSDKFDWKVPLTKQQREDGCVDKELNFENPNQYVVAVRGIPLEMMWTTSWTKQDAAGNYYAFCRANKLVEKLPGKVRVTNESHPVKEPFKMMHKSKKEPTSLNYFWQNNSHLELFASRCVDKENGTYEERSCMTCVRNGEHFEGDDIGAPNVQKCRPSGEMLFVVYELGIKDSSAFNDDPIENPININWVSVKEANVRSFDGGKLDRPFVIRMKGLGSSMMSDIGSGDYDLPVILPSHFKPKQPKKYFLPEDNVLSVQQYYRYLHDSKARDDRRAIEKTGKSLYPVMTEIYMAELHKKTATKDYIPVFRPVAVGRNTEFNGLPLAQYVKTAKAVLKHEALLASGDLTNLDTQSLPESGNNKQLTAAVAVESKTDNQPVTSAKQTLSPQAIGAFTPPSSK